MALSTGKLALYPICQSPDILSKHQQLRFMIQTFRHLPPVEQQGFIVSEVLLFIMEKPPLRVSPLIKFCRWTFLIVGIFYGASKQKFFAGREGSRREQAEKQKEMHDAELEMEKKIANEEEMAQLEKMFLQK
ncbi:hypothetical protein Zmor_026966 [Zophobas morio]|uniref:ATP synthase F(0) complex subunit e, mitochondrial n=1 Tax=Zophobas morio TaxID=2755281 RepID=A0AA38M4Y8_9CUCU|nr:hypothetical protein Zmor_026966 [Zophobas morio]